MFLVASRRPPAALSMILEVCCNARKAVDTESNIDIDIDICLAFRRAEGASKEAVLETP